MGTIIALAAAGIYVYAFKGEGDTNADRVAMGIWAVAIFGIVSALLGGDFGPLAEIGAWSKGVN